VASTKYPVCWVDRNRRSCFCDALCRRGPTIAESWAKRFADTANEPVLRRRNWPSGLTCTTISSVKSSVGTWRFLWVRCSKSQKPWAFVGATSSETSDFMCNQNAQRNDLQLPVRACFRSALPHFTILRTKQRGVKCTTSVNSRLPKLGIASTRPRRKAPCPYRATASAVMA
jgi:hypothetical protein